MTLTNLLDYLKTAGTKDVFQVLNDLNAAVSAWAAEINIKAWILFLVGLVISVAIGFLGYKMIKLVMGLGLAYVGYFVGVELFRILYKTYDWMPDWIMYIVGAVLAVAFLFLAFAKFSYVIFSVSALLSYFVLMFYTDNAVLSIGVAVVIAMLSISLIRTVFIVGSSLICGVLTVSFLSQLLPKLTFLRLEEGKLVSLIIALVLAVLFAVIQFVVNRNSGETIE